MDLLGLVVQIDVSHRTFTREKKIRGKLEEKKQSKLSWIVRDKASVFSRKLKPRQQTKG